MNPMQLKDPAAGVPQLLLPHLHLVSKHRYPLVSNLSLETIVGYLMEAPKIMRDLQPVQWRFLEPPPDGNLMLVWQPLEYLGTTFASDGYVWGDPEHAFKSDVRGYTLEIFVHRSGYGYANGEAMASHSRRRYRLLPGNPGLPPPDSSLFIVHYSKASPRDHIPAASIPIMPHIHAMMHQRNLIRTSGQINRKDFMLHDRASWPIINLPQGMHVRNQSIPMQQAHRRGASVSLVPGEATLEEEEDVSRGDLIDFLTPRDVSKARYEQHHEWMEEILESHYAMTQIIPSDLGLGRKGELEALTSGFFETPMVPFPEDRTSANHKVGKMDPGKVDDFRVKASQKIAEMQGELQAMKRRHARKKELLQRTSTLSTAEKRLRTAAYEAQQTQNVQTIDDIVQDVEEKWGKKIEQIPNVRLVEKGGLDQRIGTSNLPNGGLRNQMSPTKNMFSPSAVPLSFAQQNSPANNALQQQQEQPQPPVTQSPRSPLTQNLRSPETGKPDSALSPARQDEVQVASPQKSANDTDQDQQAIRHDDMDLDVDMAEEKELDEDHGIELDESAWVMVNENGEDNVESTPQISLPGDDSPSKTEGSTGEGSPLAANESAGVEGEGAKDASREVSAPPPAVSSFPESEALDTEDFDITGDFNDVNVDTAGDALADYGSDQEDLNMDTIDDSAFGDAFHPSEGNNTPMEDQDIS